MTTLSLHPFEDRFVERFFHGLESSGEKLITPPVDLFESGDAYRIELELPGVSKEAIEVKLDGLVLSVEAKRERAELSDGVQQHRSERSHGRYSRRFKLSNDIRKDQIKVAYDHGVLTVTIPKSEQEKVRTLEVN
jgi:HSP20 family protein